ncbi:hypothetical protein P3T39_000888 [Kitasatospora sp. GP82]|nr:hypothetical protein [Kitasatospora sp. GP82]
MLDSADIHQPEATGLDRSFSGRPPGPLPLFGAGVRGRCALGGPVLHTALPWIRRTVHGVH